MVGSMNCYVWLVVLVAEATKSTSICNVGPCVCTRNRLTCDCTSGPSEVLTLKNIGDYGNNFVSISVNHCKQLYVASNVFTRLPALQHVNIFNITTLMLEEYAFKWTPVNQSHPGLDLVIAKCQIFELPSFSFFGTYTDILLANVTIFKTRSFSFSEIICANKIQLTDVHIINDMEPLTFTNIFADHFIFSHSTMNILPTYTIKSLIINERAAFENNNIKHLKTKAFQMLVMNSLKISQSTIGYLEKDAFDIWTNCNVYIFDNTFKYVADEAFFGINVGDKYFKGVKYHILFMNNTLTYMEDDGLIFNTRSFHVTLAQLTILQICSCQLVDFWINNLATFFITINNASLSLQQLSSTVFCLGPIRGPISVGDYRQLYCDVLKSGFIKEALLIAACTITIISVSMYVMYWIVIIVTNHCYNRALHHDHVVPAGMTDRRLNNETIDTH